MLGGKGLLSAFLLWDLSVSLLVVGSLSLLVVGSLSKPARQRTAVTGHFPAWPGLGWGTRMWAEGFSSAGFRPQSVSLHLGAGLSRGPAPPRSRISPRVPPHRQRASVPPASPPSSLTTPQPVSTCVFCCSLGDCRLLLCKENFEGFEEVFSAACPAPTP